MFVSHIIVILSRSSVSPVPSSNDGILSSEAVNRPVLHAESDHSFTLSILHEQVQGKVLHKVTGVITKRLNRKEDRKIKLNGGPHYVHREKKGRDLLHVHLPFRKGYAVESVPSCLLHSSSGGPGLPFHT